MRTLLLVEAATLFFSLPALANLLKRKLITESWVSFMLMIQASVLSLTAAQPFPPASSWRVILIALSLLLLVPGIMLTTRLLRRFLPK